VSTVSPRAVSRRLDLTDVGPVTVSTVALSYEDGSYRYETALLKTGTVEVAASYANEADAYTGHAAHVRALRHR
jgi:hypothetical protein